MGSEMCIRDRITIFKGDWIKYNQRDELESNDEDHPPYPTPPLIYPPQGKESKVLRLMKFYYLINASIQLRYLN